MFGSGSELLDMSRQVQWRIGLGWALLVASGAAGAEAALCQSGLGPWPQKGASAQGQRHWPHDQGQDQQTTDHYATQHVDTLHYRLMGEFATGIAVPYAYLRISVVKHFVASRPEYRSVFHAYAR